MTKFKMNNNKGSAIWLRRSSIRPNGEMFIIWDFSADVQVKGSIYPQYRKLTGGYLQYTLSEYFILPIFVISRVVNSALKKRIGYR